jgi:hypothetical protein
MSKIAQVTPSEFAMHLVEYTNQLEPLEIVADGRLLGLYIPTDSSPIPLGITLDAMTQSAIDDAPAIRPGDLREDTDQSAPDFAALEQNWRTEFKVQ